MEIIRWNNHAKRKLIDLKLIIHNSQILLGLGRFIGYMLDGRYLVIVGHTASLIYIYTTFCTLVLNTFVDTYIYAMSFETAGSLFHFGYISVVPSAMR